MKDPLSRVLYVDDEPGFLTLCKTFLERSGGLMVETARSGPEALNLLRGERFDAIIADYQMPGMDGVELLIAVRTDPVISEIPFILFTARGREEVVIRAINNGADFYLQKGGETGIRFEELADTVKSAIRCRHEKNSHQWAERRQAAGYHQDEIPGTIIRRTLDLPCQKGETVVGNLNPSNIGGVARSEEREFRCTNIIANAPWGTQCYRYEKGNFIFEVANKAADRMLKTRTDLLREKNLVEIFPGLLAAGIPAILMKIDKTGEVWHSPVPVRFYDDPGAKTFDIFAFRTSPGNISVLLSEPENKGEELLPPRELYQSLIEVSPEVIIITDITGTIIFASPRTHKMFALLPDFEVTGKEILEWIAPECRHYAFERIARHMRGEKVTPTIYRMLHSDGTSFPAEIHSAPVHNRDGKITGVIAIIRDNSERTAQHEALERANTKLNLLSSITRHDILNKITALRLYCSLIEENEDPGQNQKMIRKIEEMATIISNLVAFSSYYQNLGINTAKWIEPVEVVSRISDLIEFGSIRIWNEFGQVRILADPLFEKVLYNLFDNAVRYGGKITIIRTGYEFCCDGLILFIEDNGIGIHPDEKEKIFERNIGHGTGLGLFLSREILSVTNLSIRENGFFGEGARFEILVPPDKYQIPK